MQHKAVVEAVALLFEGMPAAGYGRNLKFVHDASDGLPPTLREGHRGIVNVHKLTVADGTPV